MDRHKAPRLSAISAQAGERILAWRIVNQAEAVDVYLYDVIGSEAANAGDFVRELRAITQPLINLHVNSEGGLVFDALAMYAAIASHPSQVDAYIEGMAASAASFLIQAADRRLIAEHASIFIHRAMGLALGNAVDLRKLADLLEDEDDNIASIYAGRAGGSVEDWLARMDAETKFRGEQAVKAGLADAVGTSTNHAPVLPQLNLADRLKDFDLVAAMSRSAGGF